MMDAWKQQGARGEGPEDDLVVGDRLSPKKVKLLEWIVRTEIGLQLRVSEWQVL